MLRRKQVVLLSAHFPEIGGADKSHLPTASQRDKIAFTGNFLTTMPNPTRDRRVWIRFSEEEYAKIKERSCAFRTISQYIRASIKEFSDIDAKRSIDNMNALSAYYKKYDSMLFHSAANLNQYIKRANELSRVGMLNESFIKDTVLPIVCSTQRDIAFLRDKLEELLRLCLKDTLS